MRPFSAACERNRDPILQALRALLVRAGTVLEIGSGTGQHAVYFAQRLPHLQWIATDRTENHEGIRAWLNEARLENLTGPLALDVTHRPWPVTTAQYVYSANTAHIMHWPEVEAMFAGVGEVLQPGGLFCLYGPFNRDGRYTSDSNRQFDESLKARDPNMGVRDDRALNALARAVGLTPAADHDMPANNRLLAWSN